MRATSGEPGQANTFDPTALKCVGILAARHKRRVADAVRELLGWLSARGVEARILEEHARGLGLEELAAGPDELVERADLMLSLGGDGTFLKTARLAAPRGLSVVGINLGGFGFLASIPRSDMLGGLADIMEGRFRVQRRLMLQATVWRKDKSVASFSALNDVVVGKGAFSRLFRIVTSVDGERVSDLPADGMIVATPTGSTGYALSAGGPAVDPEARVVIIAPICPHTLSARTLVVPAKRVVEVSLPDPRGEDVFLTADGQEGFSLVTGDRVEVQEAPFSAHLVSPPDYSFYAKLRGKLGWGSHR